MADFRIQRFKHTWKGVWSADITYNADDVVAVSGKVYNCLVRHVSDINFYQDLNFENNDSPPLAVPRWELMSDGVSIKGNWTTGTEYFVGDIVKNGAVSYICVENHFSTVVELNFNNDFQIENYWTIFINATEWKNDWETDTYYKPGDLVKYSGKLYRCVNFHTSALLSSDGLADNIDDWEIFFVGNAWLADWTPNTIFLKRDIVRYGGNVYVCTQDHTSSTPLNGLELNFSNWELVISGIEVTGVWVAGNRYKLNDIVRYGSYLYRCVLGHTTEPSSSFDLSLWTIFCPGQEFEEDWNDLTLYRPGNVIKHGGYLFVSNTSNINSKPDYDFASVNSDWDILFNGTKIKGEWISTVPYDTGDVVRRRGQLYVAKRNVPIGQDTDILNDGSSINSEFWDLLIPGTSWRGRWTERRTYLIGDLISLKGASFRCLVKHLSNNINRPDVDQNNFWEQYTYGDPENQLLFLGDLKYFGIREDESTIGTTRLPIGLDAQTFQAVESEPTWSNFSSSNSVYYVSTNGSDIPERGQTANAPWKTVRYALEHITGPATLFVRTGRYFEILPLRIPADVAVVGDELRSTVISTAENIYSPSDILVFQDLIDYLFTIIENIILKQPIDEVLGDGFQVFEGTAGSNNEVVYVQERLSIIKSSMIGNVSVLSSTNTLTNVLDKLSAIDQIQNNFTFIREEFLGFLSNNYPNYQISVVDVYGISERILNALIYDLQYEGNYKSIEAGKYFFFASNSSENKKSNMFLLGNASGLRNMTLSGLSGELGPLNEFLTRRPTAGAYASLDPGWGPNDNSTWIVTRSPYVQNVTTFGEGCIGLKVDGDLHVGGNKTIVANDFTQILSDGIGAWCNKDGASELVSIFTYYNHIGYLCTDGGKIRGTNGNCSYGKFGAVAESFNPNETPITAKINNRYFDATVDQVFTIDGSISKLFFDHSGQDYTSSNFTLTGAGINAELLGDEFRDQAIFQSRIFYPGDSTNPGGSGYTLSINNAQIGDAYSITLAASTDDVPSTFRRLRISLDSGTGAGQYGYVADYDNSTKIALVANEFFEPYDVVETSSAGNALSIDSTAGLKINDRVCFTGDVLGGVSTNTIYYIISVTPTQVIISGSLGGPDFVLTDDLGLMNLVKLGWNHYQSGTTVVNTLNTTTSYRIEPRVIFSEPATGITSNIIGSSTDWSDMAYGNGVFVAVTGYSGSDNTISSYSLNGEDWIESTIPSGSWSRIKYGNDLFVAVSKNGKSISSEDGILWEENVIPDLEYSSLAYGDGVWIAVASGTNRAARSLDGKNWTEISLIEGADWSDIAYGKGIFVAIAQGDSTSVDRAVSTDGGVTWSVGTLGGGAKSISYGNNRFVVIAGGYVGAESTFISFNGQNWILGSIEPANWQKVTYGQGKFIAVAFGENFAAESLDGITWKTFLVNATLNYTGISFGNPNESPMFVSIATTSSTSLKILRGTRAQGRLRVASGRATGISLWEQGSGYDTTPLVSIIDPNNSTDAIFENRVANGVIGNPSIVNPGTGWVTISSRCSITGNGFADRYQLGNTIVVQEATRIPGPGSNLLISGIDDFVYRVLDATVLSGSLGNFELQLKITKTLQLEESPDHLTGIIIRENFSQVRLTGHDFLDIGLGNFEQTNYPDTLFPIGTILAPEDETKESNGGRVFYTTTDQNGNFRVGELFAVEQATGTVTISAEFFQLEGLEELSIGGVSVGGTGVVVREFSTDPLFIADSNNVIPTQKAIKEFLARRVSGGGSDAFTAQFSAGIIRIGPNIISTLTGEQIIIPVKVAFNAPIGGDMLINSMFLSGQGFVNED